MRIAYLVPTNSYSGAENMTLLIAKQLSARHDCWYCSPEGAICEYTEAAGIPHVPVPDMSVKTVKHLKKILNPDIFHACDNRASVVCALAGVTFISHLHNNPPWLKGLNAYSCTMLFSCLRSKRTIGVSDSVLDEFLFSRFIRDKYITIENVVDLSYVKIMADEGVEKKSYDLSFIGRMTQQKAPLTFVSIVEKIARQLPQISAVMIGDGEMISESQAFAEQLGLRGSITFTGFLQNPFTIIKNTRLLIMPSLYEGFGLTAVEAMALGKPVLASPVGGLVKILDSTCGKYCGSEDEFIKAAIKLLTDNELYIKMSQGAEERAQLFGDVSGYAAGIEKIYTEAIGG